MSVIDLVVIVLGVPLCIFLLVGIVKSEKVNRAYDDFDEAGDALRAWRKERPKLYVSQCDYSRSLVLRMIDAKLVIKKYYANVSALQKICTNDLRRLYRLLNETPPSNYPPAEPSAGSRRAVSVFIYLYFKRLSLLSRWVII